MKRLLLIGLCAFAVSCTKEDNPKIVIDPLIPFSVLDSIVEMHPKNDSNTVIRFNYNADLQLISGQFLPFSKHPDWNAINWTLKYNTNKQLSIINTDYTTGHYQDTSYYINTKKQIVQHYFSGKLSSTDTLLYNGSGQVTKAINVSEFSFKTDTLIYDGLKLLEIMTYNGTIEHNVLIETYKYTYDNSPNIYASIQMLSMPGWFKNYVFHQHFTSPNNVTKVDWIIYGDTLRVTYAYQFDSSQKTATANAHYGWLNNGSTEEYGSDDFTIKYYFRK
ncbi:hypothetical protein ACE38W_10345 [Chitinophaga sp. Hz27]|uniref:hypothetical protein n=1 Tax=Chitinophaga sp. Hz27 TaxID=3347169 RepID=UPI0035D7E94A